MILGFAAIPMVIWFAKTIALPVALPSLAFYTLNGPHLEGLSRRFISMVTHTFGIMACREEVEKRTFIGTIFF